MAYYSPFQQQTQTTQKPQQPNMAPPVPPASTPPLGLPQSPQTASPTDPNEVMNRLADTQDSFASMPQSPSQPDQRMTELSQAPLPPPPDFSNTLDTMNTASTPMPALDTTQPAPAPVTPSVAPYNAPVAASAVTAPSNTVTQPVNGVKWVNSEQDLIRPDGTYPRLRSDVTTDPYGRMVQNYYDIDTGEYLGSREQVQAGFEGYWGGTPGNPLTGTPVPTEQKILNPVGDATEGIPSDQYAQYIEQLKAGGSQYAPGFDPASINSRLGGYPGLTVDPNSMIANPNPPSVPPSVPGYQAPVVQPGDVMANPGGTPPAGVPPGQYPGGYIPPTDPGSVTAPPTNTPPATTPVTTTPSTPVTQPTYPQLTPLDNGMAAFGKGSDALEARINRMRERGQRSVAERAAERGVVGGSPELGMLTDLESELQVQGQEGEANLLQQLNSYQLNTRAQQLEEQGMQRDDAFRYAGLEQSRNLQQQSLDLQAQGMSQDEAFRYAALSQDANFNQKSLDLQKLGLDQANSYKLAELAFQKDQFGQTLSLEKKRLGAQIIEILYGLKVDPKNWPQWLQDLAKDTQS